jgi:hypothetical protein
MRILKLLRGLLLMLPAAAGVVALLAALNWLPSLTQKDFAMRYNSIDEAKRSTGIATVLKPAYFPEGISWPPSFIVAQKKPYQALVMEFRGTASGKTSLIIIQSSSPDAEEQFQRIRISEIKEETEYRLKGRPAVLRIGTCDNGSACSTLAWLEGDIHHSVLFVSSPFELIKVSESMIR